MPSPSTSDPNTPPLWRLHLVHGGLPIGAVAAAFVAGTSVLLGVPIDGELLALAFCGTALVYLMDRAADWSPEDAVNRPSRARWRNRARTWIYAEAAVLALGALAAAATLRLATLGAGLVLGSVGLMHVVPILPGRRRLKAWGLWKPVSIGLVWALGGVVLPAVEAGTSPWTVSVAGLVAYRFLFVLPNVLLADWSDRAGDAAVGLTTVGTTASLWTLRLISTEALVGALGMALWIGGRHDALALWTVDALGPVLMLGVVWLLRPGATRGRTLVLDLIVAWPAVTAVVSLWMGG